MEYSVFARILNEKNQREPWEEWFAWKPVKADNKWVWCKKVYRRRHFTTLLKITENWQWVYTANVFEILKQFE